MKITMLKPLTLLLSLLAALLLLSSCGDDTTTPPGEDGTSDVTSETASGSNEEEKTLTIYFETTDYYVNILTPFATLKIGDSLDEFVPELTIPQREFIEWTIDGYGAVQKVTEDLPVQDDGRIVVYALIGYDRSSDKCWYEVHEDGTTCTLQALPIKWLSEAENGALEIPSEVDGYQVTKLDDYITNYANGEQYHYTKVIVPEGITVLGESAFSGTDADEIILPTTLKTVEGGAFSYCRIESITVLATMTDIQKGAFNSYKGTIIVPKGVTLSEDATYAFDGEIVYEE